MQYFSGDNLLIAEDHIFVNCCTVKTSTEFHAHNFIEIAYIASGCGFHKIGDNVYPVKAGSIAVIDYDIPHLFKSSDEPLCVYNCIFAPVFFDYMLKDSRSLDDVCSRFLSRSFYKDESEKSIIVDSTGNDNLHILNIYNKMSYELSHKKIGYLEMSRSFLIDLLITIFRLSRKQQDNKYDDLSEAIDYIAMNYKCQISTKELAKIFAFSETTFCRKFKSMTNMTVTSYIQTLRIEEACKLLVNTDKNVETIANEVGYRDIKHFYSIFKRITGKLPGDFRFKI